MSDPPSQPKQLDLNLDYFKTHAGQLRVAQGVLSLAALISSVEGQCTNDNGRYGFFLFIVIITMLEAIFIIVIFVLRLDKKVPTINVPLSLLLNDGITLILLFINCTLSMLSIGRCSFRIEARIIATLFVISLFLVYVGLSYTDYKWWQEESNAKETSNNGSTTITETSPTVLA